jgi:ABC-type multidrug transport system ATPase subunit
LSKLKLSSKDISNSDIAERLADVKLTKVADNRSSTFSGGMKRRLSVAISTIGNPKIIFMDEPTT